MDFRGIKRHKVRKAHCHAPRFTAPAVEYGGHTITKTLAISCCLRHPFRKPDLLGSFASICIPGSPTRSGTSPKDIEPPRSMEYPYSRRIAASSLSPSAPLRCDRFPPFARLASPACEFLTFCGVAYHLPSFNVSCGFLTALIAHFKEPHRPNLAGEKMVDVIVTVVIFCSKVLVDHRRIVKR